jgi:hypothetical protein
VIGTMSRMAIVFSLCSLLSPMAAWADTLIFINQLGSVTLSETGIVSTQSQITEFYHDGEKSPHRNDLGWVSFSTGTLASGSLLGGGTFSSNGSSFIVTGFGQHGLPNGTIFSGSFYGPIYWTLVKQSGDHYTFDLSGGVTGMLYNGRTVEGATNQTISVNLGNPNLGNIHSGRSGFGGGLSTPEPGTLLLFSSGLTVMVGVMRRKFPGTLAVNRSTPQSAALRTLTGRA